MHIQDDGDLPIEDPILCLDPRLRWGQELALGVYGPVTTRSQIYLALVAAWRRDGRHAWGVTGEALVQGAVIRPLQWPWFVPPCARFALLRYPMMAWDQRGHHHRAPWTLSCRHRGELRSWPAQQLKRGCDQVPIRCSRHSHPESATWIRWDKFMLGDKSAKILGWAMLQRDG